MLSRREFLVYAGLAVVSAVVGEGFLKAAEATRHTKPNVLLIICDDLNDYSGAFRGHPQARTPNIDKLARSGVTFANAHSNSPVCSPSRNSLFTGVYTHKSKDFGWTAHYKQPVLKNCKTLMEYFKENGYQVVGSGKLLHHNLNSLWDEWGVEINNYGPFAYNGKDLVGHPSVPEPFRSIGAVDGSFAPLSDVPTFPENSVGPDKPGWIYSWDKKKHLNYIDENNRDLTPDEMHSEWAVRKIKQMENQKEQKPFFMGIGFVRPHTPLYAPKRFFDMFPTDEIKLSPIKEGDAEDCYYTTVYPLTRKGPRYYRLLKESYPDIEPGLKHFLQAYLACIAFVDEQIGAVIDALNNSKFRDNTIIVFTSDHGWNMGEKEYLFKNSPWEESTRVPLIIRAPGESIQGSKVDHPVSLIDIYPTLTDLCHLEGNTMRSDSGATIDGYSLQPFLRNPEFQNWDGPDGALTVLGVGVNKEDVLEQNYAYRTKNWRYILYRNGEEELYNHQNDPYEWNNLAADEEYAEKKQELRDQMMNIVRKDLETVEATRLGQAVADGKIEQVKLLISEGADVNEKTTTGDTPLHSAVRYGHEDVAKLLIAKGAYVNERNADGDTPLHYAAKYGHKNVAVLLITKGADVNAKNKNGDLPTHLALRGHLESPKMEVLELLIAKGPKLSCIQISAYQGDLAKVRNFVEQGIDVDSRDSEGRTALYYAAMQGKRDVVEFLLSRGANVNAKDKDVGFMPLHHAVGGGHKDVVELLIAKGADVNATDKYGWTPLDSSVYGGNTDIPELLIEAGANVNSRYGWGQTPLIWAAQEGHTPVVQLLIVKGANVNAQDDQGLTPLHYAADEGHKDVAELLIAKGAGVNAKNQRGESPLSMAKANGRKELVELLRKHGAKE